MEYLALAAIIAAFIAVPVVFCRMVWFGKGKPRKKEPLDIDTDFV
jgi:hypothetical protein